MRGILDSQETHQVLSPGPENIEAVPDTSGAPRKVRDENTSPRTRHTSGEGGIGCLLLPSPPYGLGDAQGGPIQNRFGRFRSHVSWAKPGASSGQDQIEVSAIDPSKEGGNNDL